MIKVHAYMDAGDSAFSLSADGHADAQRNDDGRDLVCCAVSTIVGVLANSCALIEDVRTVYHSRKGHALVTVSGITDDLWAEINSRYQMAVDGLQALAVQYPECLCVKVTS